MRTADLMAVAGLAAVGLLVLWDALRLGIGWSTDGPRSGFFPFWLGVLLLACCGIIAGQTLARRPGKRFVRREALGPVLQTLAPAAAFVLLTQLVGLYVAAALYMGAYMRWIGRHSWLAVALVGLGFPLVTFVVFERWFLVPMPKGPLEAWLGY